MVDPTPNKFLREPANGSNLNVWDVPVNGNTTIIDNSFGGNAYVQLTNAPVSLSSGQYQNVFLTFYGANTVPIDVTIPHVGSFYKVQNLTTNASNYVRITTGTGQIVGIPPGENTEIFVDTASSAPGVKYCSLDAVGTYWDYAGSSVPGWVDACTVPPYLNCDGTAFSSATYPILATILGGVTLPDSRGRYRASLNQGQSRITSGSSTGGVDANTLFASGGAQTTTLSSQNAPPILITDPGHTHSLNFNPFSGKNFGADPTNILNSILSSGYTTNSNVTGISAGNATPTNFSNLPPTYVGGITMVRSA